MMAASSRSSDTEPAPGAVAKSTGRRIGRGAFRMFRRVLAGGLLAVLAPVAWGDGGSGQPPEPAAPESCVHAPTAQCVIRLSLAAVEGIADADATRAEALARVAEAQVSAGESGEARKSLSRALAAAAGVDAAAYAGDSWIKTSPEAVAFGERARVFSLIARVQTDMGDAGGARETFSRAVAAAEAMEYGHVRSAALVEVAKMQVAAGALPEARQTLARADLTNVWFFIDHELRELVRAQAEAGDVAGALVTARSIPGDEFEGAWALANVVAVQAAAGDEPGALVTAGEIESEHYRMQAMRHIGIARAERGDVAGAWDAVREIKDDIWFNPHLRDDTGGRDVTIAVAGVIAAIAEAHLEKGEFEKAFAAIEAEDMEDDFTFVWVRTAIAKARTAAGHFDAARGDAEALCGGWRYRRYCVEALAALAAALVAAGRADEGREAASTALDEADRVEYDSDRAQAFVAAYTALMRVGEVEAARRAFSSALAVATAEENEDEYWQAEVFIRMGAAAAREGDSDSADRLVANGEMAPHTLVLAGLAWTRAGDADVARAMFSHAVAAATTLETAWRRAKALAEIAFALASGRWPAADDYPGHFQ